MGVFAVKAGSAQACARVALTVGLVAALLCGWCHVCPAQPPEAPAPQALTVREALAAAAGRLLPVCLAAPKVAVLVPEGAGEPACYAAAMIAFFLSEGGVRAEAGADPAVPAEPPEQLSPDLLVAWKQLGVPIAVIATVREREQAYDLAVAAYALEDGTKLASAGGPLVISADLAFLPAARPEELTPEDAQWAELFGYVFAPCRPAEGKPEQALALAEGTHFLKRGLWAAAAVRLQESATGPPSMCLARLTMALRNATQPEAALDRVEAMLKLHPDSGPLYALKAWLLLRRGAAEDALIFLEQARLSDVPHEGYYWVARHMVALERGQKEAAEQALLQGAELLPGVPFAQLRAARFYWREARLGEAVRFYQAALQAGATGADVWAELGMALDAAGRPEEALDAFRRASEREPGNPSVARHLSGLLKSTGMYDDALQVMKQAAEARPDRMELLTGYADMAAELWRTALAEEAYGRAAARDQESAAARVGLARMLVRQRRLPQARGILEELLAAHPDYQPARIALAEIIASEGDSDAAVQALQEAMRNPKHEVAARMVLARLYLGAGQAQNAIQEAQLAVAAQSDPDGYALLARAFITAQEWEKAEGTVRKALESAPRTPVAHLAAAELAAARGQMEQALAEAEEAVRLGPYLPEALTLAGTLYLRLDQPDRCADIWEGAALINPWDPGLQWDLAELLRLRLARTQEAAGHYRRHIELNGDRSKEAERLLRELEAPPHGEEPGAGAPAAGAAGGT